jgi:hypothetical protein
MACMAMADDIEIGGADVAIVPELAPETSVESCPTTVERVSASCQSGANLGRGVPSKNLSH